MNKEIHSKIDHFIAMVNAGEKRMAVAKEFGISHIYASGLATFCGVEFARKRGVGAKRKERDKNILHDYAFGIKGKVIAFKYGVSVSTVSIVIGRKTFKGVDDHE